MVLSNLQTRILSAAILIPVAVFILWYGGFIAIIALAFIAALAAWEWGNIIEKTSAYTLPKIILIVSSVSISLLWGYAFLKHSYADLLINAILVILALNLVFFLFCKNSHKSYYIMGFLVIAFTSLSLIFLRFSEGVFSSFGDITGFHLLLYLFIITWVMDSGAYFCGRFFKGPKLAPKISPNKTWSGFIGGLVFILILSIAMIFIFKDSLSFEDEIRVVILNIILAALGHGGDLAESAFKRRFNVKDSSQIIPGHGGVLDRLDSLAVSSWFFSIVCFFHVLEKFNNFPF